MTLPAANRTIARETRILEELMEKYSCTSVDQLRDQLYREKEFIEQVIERIASFQRIRANRIKSFGPLNIPRTSSLRRVV